MEMNNFPGGSRSRVNKAGYRVKAGTATQDDLGVIEEWREAHRIVLNTFQALLRNRTKDFDIYVAQRHKRRNTIFNKLMRHPKMELARMDDVAGCRIIFPDLTSLYKFRNSFHHAKFKHKLRNETDKYDYIKQPKATGYRGIHDVYSYDVNSKNKEKCKGLFVEIQYRTQVQHAWATAVEVIGFITESQPKFQQGDKRYEKCMSLASDILARAHEGLKGSHAELSNEELIHQFNSLNSELRLTSTLSGLNESKSIASKHTNFILIFSPDGGLDVKTYPDATVAMRKLFEIEKNNPSHDVVLVKAATTDEVRFAFRNYFSDAKDFVNLLKTAIEKLS